MFPITSVSVTKRDLLELFEAIEEHIVEGEAGVVRERFEAFWEDHEESAQERERVRESGKEQKEKRKIQEVFARLRNSLHPVNQVPLLNEAELEAISMHFDRHAPDSRERHARLVEQDKLTSKRTGLVAYHRGRIYHQVQEREQLSLTRLCGNFGITYYDAQKCVQIYSLLTELPRLRHCSVPATFLHENATIILRERWREADADDWLNPDPPAPTLEVATPEQDAAADGDRDALGVQLQQLLDQAGAAHQQVAQGPEAQQLPPHAQGPEAQQLPPHAQGPEAQPLPQQVPEAQDIGMFDEEA